MKILILSEPVRSYDDFQSLNGVTFINLKGTHEENPNNGFAVSVAPDGEENLVEGPSKKGKDAINKVGEVILNDDYVLSDRLKIDNDKSLIEKYGLKEGMTYAEAFRKSKTVKEAEDRPNDALSKSALEALKNDFIASQESYKAKRQEKKDAKAFDSLTPDQQLGLMEYINALQQSPEQQMMMGDVQFGEGGKIHIKPENRGKFTASAKRAGMGVQEFARHVLANKEDYSSTQVKRANFARNASKWKHAEGGNLFPLGGWENVIAQNNLQQALAFNQQLPTLKEYMTYTPVVNTEEPIKLNVPSTEDWLASLRQSGFLTQLTPEGYTPAPVQEVQVQDTQKPVGNVSDWMTIAARTAPIIANLANLARQPKPNYGYMQSAEAATSAIPVANAPAVNKYYAQYNPIDTNYLMTRFGQLAAAQRRLAREQSANRANVLANTMASNYQTQGLMGQAYFQAQQENQRLKEALRQYLTSTDLINSDAALRAQQLNQARQQAIANMLYQGADFRESLRGSDLMTRAGLIGGIGSNIGDMAREAFLRRAVSQGLYSINPDGTITFNNKKEK